MLEGLVAYVLNNYLGKYVENLNTDQLSIALLSGEVELENLPLKREALRNLGLPVEIKAGFIGKVRLQVPVTQIRTASWVIVIEQLYLVAGPINLDEYDTEAEKQAFVDYKLSRLESLEARWRADMERDPGYYATSYSSWLNYGTSLVTNVIENLQLNIKDVHLRYEHPTSSTGNGVAFGIVIDGITAQSCDATLNPGATSWNTTDASYKLMELDGLSVYWNNIKKEQFFGSMSLGDLTVEMSQSKKEKWNHILSPVSAKANIKRDRSEKPLRSVNRPRIVINLSLDKVPLSLTDKQYREIVNCIKNLEHIDRQRSQRRCRPLVSVSDSPKEWWIYAARCYVGKRSFKPKVTWEYMLQRGRNNKLYIEACAKLLGSPTSVLPPDTKTLKDSMEQERSYDELRVLREIAMLRVMPPKIVTATNNGNSTQARGMLVQWFPHWWGWNSKPNHSSAHSSTSSSTFDGELLDALADTIDDDTLLRRDMVFGQFNFTLTKGAFSLCIVDEENRNVAPKPAMELQFEKVDLTYESRPRSGSHKFFISLGALYLHDYLTEKSSFPILVQPQGAPTSTTVRLGGSSSELVSQSGPQALFELIYEKKPLHRNFDHSLHIQSRSLDVVYNPHAIQWLVDFLCEPHRYSPNERLQAMKRRTRRRLMRNWEQILEGDFVYRSSWDLQLNISAPQILLVEKFTDSNAAVVVVDFGKLHLSNNMETKERIILQSPTSEDYNVDEDEEYERFETPCSTPPGSQENSTSAPIEKPQVALSEVALHDRLYDHYSIDLADLQVLIGKVKDNWKHARTRTTSSMHLLERFNISLQIKRRVVTTSDPYHDFPNVTISSILPKLVVHINEQKVHSIRLMGQLLSKILTSSSGNDSPEVERRREEEEEDLKNEGASQTHAVMVQFMIDQMTFELQSRGRSVAELQVSGVKVALQRASDLQVSLSVHGLLLVDALQEFGPDFELLIASHKHVGMDSVSGSLRDSEPTSPVSPMSPGSPDHAAAPRRLTSPIALTHALSSLARGADPKSPFSPRSTIPMGLDQMDSEALIVIELRFIEDESESLRIANIQFNNLDIIANQVTIVELMGFARRLFPSKTRSTRMERQASQSSLASEPRVSSTRTEVTFDFHRLNVLFLRAVMQDGTLTGQKIATATMSDARIEAKLATDNFISGSLGGLQLLDQTLIGKTHQRIISVGRDPLVDDSQVPPTDYFPSLGAHQQDALEFSFQRNYSTQDSDVPETTAIVKIRVASVWYTHAPHLISELRSCADEFKQYLSNLARQIGAAATDMAIGLVQSEDWSLPPRKRLLSFSTEGIDNAASLSLNLDILLESPVLVVPRSSQSLQVFVAHLGTMSLQHESSKDSAHKQKLSLELRDMNLYSLDVNLKPSQTPRASMMPVRAEEMYCCSKFGKPILHDTMLRVEVERESAKPSARSPGFLADLDLPNVNPVVQVRGAVVTPLKVSLSRAQYEQLQDTLHRLFSMPPSEPAHNIQKSQPQVKLETSYPSEKFDLSIRVLFELPVLSIQLKQDRSEHQPLVELSMRDFIVKYEKLQRLESTMQVSLRSLLMEDLLCPVGSRHRFMMQSSAPNRARMPIGVSRSCPDLTVNRPCLKRDLCGSLPDRLETDTLYGAIPEHWRRKQVSVMKIDADTPSTPPPSPGGMPIEENLVLISVTTKTPGPDFTTEEQRIQKKVVSVDFNCLDLVIRVESWMVVLDFLGIGAPSATFQANVATVPVTVAEPNLDELPVHSETEVEVRSLTLVLTHTDREIAKTNVSDVTIHVLKDCGTTKVFGSLGSMSLLDLTSHGRLYRERFLISGRKALHFQYLSYSDTEKRPYDAQLKLQMSAVHYVHTQRFVAELQTFFLHFSRLRTVMANLRAGRSAVINVNERSTRLSLELHAAAPIILLPVSSRSEEMVLLDLGELTARNTFEISESRDGSRPPLLLDLMNLDLVNMDVYAARRLKGEEQVQNIDTLVVGSFVVLKSKYSLLTDKCHLKLRVERNLDSYLSREIPDVSVYGTLSTMDCALDPEQYMLIRGLLSYNIGENLDDLRAFMQGISIDTTDETDDSHEKVWTRSYMNFELVNVTLKLHPHRGLAALACVNFIKSKLTVDSLSDGSQDIDLVSREILVTDTRFTDEPENRRSNVFSSILKPLTDCRSSLDRVQAEIHHRRRTTSSSTTILLHSMRLTAILDWWEAVKDFLFLKFPEPESHEMMSSMSCRKDDPELPRTESPAAFLFELKLNITDSELVLVEDTSLWDTNAVIFKCTAILSYHTSPQEGEKTLSCNLSHCELFSCILGMEEETALSIIDPVGASLELNRDKCLEVQLQPLSVRLSYHDVNMFQRMLNSLPKQTLWAKQKSSSSPTLCSPDTPTDLSTGFLRSQHIAKLSALGFSESDCETALDKCNGHLDDAALWLTQHAIPNSEVAARPRSVDAICRTVELETACLRICVIDDCRDADVPLMELRLSDLSLAQQRREGSGSISATFGVDYYNRELSGWEPFIEPWRAKVKWDQALTSNLTQRRMKVKVDSQDSVNVNVTYTLVQLVQLVKENWTQDYYLANNHVNKMVNGLPEYRRRSPFIPFALKNETGSALWFKTYISSADDLKEFEKGCLKKELQQRDETWVEVPPGETVPFTFEGRGKLRHHSTHIVRRHQVAVAIDGWRVMDPVSVDKVGVYFRHAMLDSTGSEVPTMKARVIFNVELEGSARKLVTIRSALRLVNKLSKAVEVKMVKSLSQFRYSFINAAASGRILQVPPHSEVSVAITHTDMDMTLRPVHSERTYQYCTETIHWSIVKKPLEVKEIFISCRDNQSNFFRVTVAIKRDNYPVDINDIPGHTITILAPITFTNLLPHELMYRVGKDSSRILPGESSDLHNYNSDESLEIVIQVEGYPGAGTLVIPQYSTSFTSRLRILDAHDRVLFLHAAVVVERGAAIRVNITAPYWIINKTGLPLVFRQEGVGTDFAGQFDEHEKARMVAPLLFSFSDEEASRTIAVRIGTGIHPHGVPQWSQHFYLHPGVQVHRLRVTLRDNRPELVYLIGVTTRMAKGRYRATTVVTLSPRYQLHNRSSSTLELAQKCFTTTISHPDAQATYITATPNCHMPFHWPRLDKDQLLCVRILDVPDCIWSGGITLQGNHSLTINVRNSAGRMHFLRVDVVLQESTYFIVFTDANTMPPPIRVDNFSEVPLNINQAGVPESLQWTVRPHTSVPYALDESSIPAILIVAAPGGIMSSHDLNLLGDNKVLTYENFIYIAFTGTFKTNGDLGTGENNLDPMDVEMQRLVLEAGSGGWVALRRQQPGNRAQLWRMTSEGQLQHEGSSPPRDKHSRSTENVLVLDIAGTAPQPFSYCTLALRRPDPRRKSTQTWKFTDDGRLCCAHKNMCVQSKDGFMGLHEGSEAVLGPQTHGEVPLAQRVGRVRLRPGSGFLSVQVTTDGPTRVLQILDMNERKKPFAVLEERDWSNIAEAQRPNQMNYDLSCPDDRELELSVTLSSGLGLSIVSHRPVEELLFARFAGIYLELNRNCQRTTTDLKIGDVQVDNQLFEAQCTSVLYISRTSKPETDSRPAVHLLAEKLPSRNQNAEIYRQLLVTVKPICVYLEERLILKLAAFVGVGRSDLAAPVDENDFNAQRFIYDVSAAHAKRYYFGTLKLVPSQVTLSVLTSTKLPPHLQSIKKKLGLMLIKFEGATIDLEPFIRTHPFESQQFLIHSIVKHYKDELKWQAATILGSVDFLGNPMGLMADFTEGITGFIYEGNVKALLKNFTHGVTNSAAKFTGSLSDGLGRVIMDERHEEARQRMRVNSGKSMDHLMAGFRGLGFGIFGGLTSIIRETYDGATNEGFPGFVAGIGRGMVGTVTKPVVGILDFASEAATAVREQSKSTHRVIPKRDRLPRVASGPAGLLPPYNHEQSEGQEFLYNINDRDFTELFVAYECLRSGSENLRMLVSNERIRIISGGTTKDVVTEMNLADLLQCQPTHKMESNGSILHYIELTCRADSMKAVTFDGHEALKCPKVRCDNEDVAKWVSQQINYAKSMYEERCLTLASSDNILDDIHNYK